MYPRTFQCPNCKEIINETSERCRFCLVPVDPATSQLLAGRQELVNRACNDASYLRTIAVAQHVALVGSLLLSMFYVAFLVTFWLGVGLLIRWQLKFSNLLTNDPDYLAARRSKNISVLLLAAGLVLGLLLNPILPELIAAVLRRSH